MESGIFIRFHRSLGGHSREVFVLSEDLTVKEIEREIGEYLKVPLDTFLHGDLKIEEEKCRIWKALNPLKKEANIVLAEIWSGSQGTGWAFACRNEREIKEVLRHAMNHEQFDKLSAKIYRKVPVLRVPVVERKDGIVEVETKVKALERGLDNH